MVDTNDDIDDVRYQHHLKHRGSVNQKVFWVFWSCVVILVLIRFIRAAATWWCRRASRTHHFTALSQTNRSIFRRTWEFIQAVAVAPFPQIPGLNITTLASGRILGIATYVIIIVSMLLSVNAPVSTSHFVDDVAFRAAWVTITQIPLVFFLSTKRGLINIVAKVSYDRLAWVHRWAGRMIFVSATTHVVIMKSSISLADVLLSHDKGATIVRFGIGSYLLLVWIAVGSILPLRKWSYRAFHINHIVSTLSFLMIVVQHAPKHATTPIFLAFGFVFLDKSLVIIDFLRTNISVRPSKIRFARFRRAPGHVMLVAGYPLEMLEPHNLNVSIDTEESVTTIRLCNLPMTWRPGQHIRLYLPTLGAFEMHPFTPANSSSIAKPPPLPPRRSRDLERGGSSASASQSRQSNDMLLLIRAQSGLTRRLKDFHTEWLKLPCPNATLSPTATSLTAYVDGPYGNPPTWEDYEHLLLITTATGVSFALAIMDYLEQLCLSGGSKLVTRTIRFIWIIRHIDPQLEATVVELLQRYSTMLRESGVRVETELYITCAHAKVDVSAANIDQFAHLRPRLPRYGSGDRTLTIRNPDEIYDEWEEEERQWAEMEALEEMQMKEFDPFADVNEVGSRCSEDKAIGTYEGGGYASSETSTLLDEANVQQSQRDSKSFSEVRLTSDETMALNLPRPLSSPVLSPLLLRDTRPQEKACQCTLIQYQRQKLHKPRRPWFGSTSYATRPDISRLVTSAVNNDPHYKSMVATCANGGVSREVSSAVSAAKFAFARGLRPTIVDIFTEGFC
ncbi:transmembrane metalloreductase [Stagonosporopsis vannaccii]|nr:transmembrane metalloreductase [Stagonosporopsis vannaccii]